jgi:NitT/TauT family transport system substrate-binding protein
MQIRQSRRHFLAGLSAISAAGVLDARGSLADEGPPETTTVRFEKDFNNICFAPQYLAEELLRAEGFADIRYVENEASGSAAESVAKGTIDFSQSSAMTAIRQMDTGAPVAVLAGVHPGCYELFAHEPVHTITDLKGRSVGIPQFRSGPHLFISVMAAYVGLDPAKNIRWVESNTDNVMELFADGKIDAFLGYPPEPQELRARKLGRVIVSTATDKPWAQYFCCMLNGNTDYVRKYPVATKRVLRAILKAADMCAAEPTRTAQRMVDRGFTPRYDYALQALGDLPYGKWREYDPEDTLRFYALRLHELGFIKSSPNQLIAEGTDWRFLNELKRELKA